MVSRRELLGVSASTVATSVAAFPATGVAEEQPVFQFDTTGMLGLDTARAEIIDGKSVKYTMGGPIPPDKASGGYGIKLESPYMETRTGAKDISDSVSAELVQYDFGEQSNTEVLTKYAGSNEEVIYNDE